MLRKPESDTPQVISYEITYEISYEITSEVTLRRSNREGISKMGHRTDIVLRPVLETEPVVTFVSAMHLP